MMLLFQVFLSVVIIFIIIIIIITIVINYSDESKKISNNLKVKKFFTKFSYSDLKVKLKMKIFKT